VDNYPFKPPLFEEEKREGGEINKSI